MLPLKYSYSDPFTRGDIYYPVPVNYIVRYWRKYKWAPLRYWIGLYQRDIQGFYKIKTK